MLCPVCKNVDLQVADRQGIEVDYCPNCRGVWLDRGELDKIIERTAAYAPRQEQSGTSDMSDFEVEKPKRGVREGDYRRDDFRSESMRRDEDDDYKYHKGERSKKKGFLSDLFDIFD